MINQNGYASRIISATGLLSAMLLMLLVSPQVQAQNSLSDITYSTLPGDKVQIKLKLEHALQTEPASFTIDNPARIAFDLPDTRLGLDERTKDVGVGVARSVTTAEAGGRTRVVLNLSKLVSYTTTLEGNDVVITLNESGETTFAATDDGRDKTRARGASVNVLDLDFRRGASGEGRVEMTLADPNTTVDMKRRGSQVVVTLKNSALEEKLERRVDVQDFATPVSTVDAFNQGNDVRVVINTVGEFEHIAYQADQRLTIDVKPVVKDKEEERPRHREVYTGEKLSLNFQNIEVRAVLQLIADFTGINMVTSDTVSGNVTLRLKNVPWDQALDLILKTKGLDKRQNGNVMLIAPAEEIAAREKLELEANKQVEALAPLINETIQVNYAKASEMAALLKTKGSEFLSERGNVSVDERTNKLLVQETADRIDAIISLVSELDVPVRQVLIESRIVLASTNFSKEVGVRFGVSRNYVGGDGRERAVSGNLAATENLIDDEPLDQNRWNVNLPAASASAGTIGMALARLPFGTLVELELSAAQAEGETEIVSSPRVITANQQEAVIESGQEIPYQEASSSGATSVSFKKAVLSLTVTPQITPDDRVIMDLEVTSDNPDFGNLVLGVPPITTQSVQTQVLINNGETVVLGGVYEQTKSNTVTRVPFFSDLPIVGALFRSKAEIDEKSELLIFVTPKIIKDDMQI